MSAPPPRTAEPPATEPPTEEPPPAEPPAESPPPAAGGRRSIAPRVFYPAAAVIIGFVLWTLLAPDGASSAISWLQDGIIDSFGWYYMVVVAGFVVFALVVGLSHFGNIKLGRDDEKPEFSLKAWLAMLFAAGMGIGLVFWGVAEPLNHLASPRPGWDGTEAEIGQQAMVQTFLHWGIHAWAIYVVVGLAIAYAVHRKGRPVSIRWALEPVLGRHVRGWLGDLVDIVAIVGTIFGVATSLGLGALQIAEGMNILWDIEAGNLVLALLIIAITAVAVLSVVTGIKRGIKWLSQLNVSMAGLLLVFVLIAGPTVLLMQGFVESIGAYLQNLLRLSFDVGAAQGEDGLGWAAGWTTFYWGWWISWAAFVGIFIARISRGRTVRQFVAGVLLVPSLVSFLWFAVLGGTAIDREVTGPGGLIVDGAVATEGALFGLLDGLPAGTFVSIGVLILITLFFVTSSDSGSLVVDMLASGGDPDPPTWSRVFWAVLEGLVAIALLVLIAGDQGLLALQTASIVAALPVSLVMIAMCVAIWRQFQAERTAWLAAERRRNTKELTEQVSQAMIDDGLIEDRNGSGTTAPRTGS